MNRILSIKTSKILNVNIRKKGGEMSHIAAPYYILKCFAYYKRHACHVTVMADTRFLWGVSCFLSCNVPLYLTTHYSFVKVCQPLYPSSCQHVILSLRSMFLSLFLEETFGGGGVQGRVIYEDTEGLDLRVQLTWGRHFQVICIAI
jgi:hypothetical protein